jgi:molybdopterin-binding protein
MAIDAALGRLGIQTGVCTSSTRPANPYEGQVIYETDTNNLRFWSGSAWESNKGAVISSAAPTSPAAGDIWYDSDDGRAYVYYDDGSSQQWVEFGAPPVQHGKILQVIEGSQSTRVTIASTAYTDTNLTATITPTAATSKVLVIVSQSFAVFRSTNDIIRGQMKLLRDATDLQEYAAGVVSAGSDVAGNLVVGSQQSYTYLDSPSSTSALVYKTQAKCHTTANNGRIFANGDDASSLTSYITLLEVSA